MPGNFSFTPAPKYQSGYSEAGAAVRGLQPTTVPIEQRFPGENFAQAWVQHAQAAATVLPAVAAPALGVALMGLQSQARSEAQDAARAAAVNAGEAREQWATGFRDFGATLAAQQATFGRELRELRAISGGTSQTYFQTPFPTSNRGTSAMSRFPNSGGGTRLIQALRRGRRILTLEDL